MMKEMRYHIHGFFKEEQRRGFVVCHELDKHVETIVELQDVSETFLASYNPRFCYGLAIGIAEEPTLVE